MTLRQVVFLCAVSIAFSGCETPDDNDGDAGVIELQGDGAMGEGETDAGVDQGIGPPQGDAGSPPSGPLTPASSCEEIAAQWPAEWVRFEDQVLERVNEFRAQGYDCRSGGQFPAALPLTMNEALRCAARRHSIDMAQRGFFSHVSPEGEAPDVRVGRTPYQARAIGENIAAGQRQPDGVMQGWMNSDGHCANIMNSVFEELGVGYYKLESTRMKHFWTQVFGSQ